MKTLIPVLLSFLVVTVSQSSVTHAKVKTRSVVKTESDYVINILLKSRSQLKPLDRFILRNKLKSKKTAPSIRDTSGILNFKLPNGSLMKLQYVNNKGFRINGRAYSLKKHESLWRFLKRNQKKIFNYRRGRNAFLEFIESLFVAKCSAEEVCPSNPYQEDMQTTHQVLSHLFSQEACGEFCPDGYQVDCETSQINARVGNRNFSFSFPGQCPGRGTVRWDVEGMMPIPANHATFRLDSDCRTRTFGNSLDGLVSPQVAEQLGQDIRLMAIAIHDRQCQSETSGDSSRPESSF